MKISVGKGWGFTWRPIFYLDQACKCKTLWLFYWEITLRSEICVCADCGEAVCECIIE